MYSLGTVGRKIVFLSESDEVTKSDFCIQETHGNVEIMNARSLLQRMREKRCSNYVYKYERDGEDISDAKCHVYHCRYF